MYLPNNCDAVLAFPLNSKKVKWVGANRERTIIVVATDCTLFFYSANYYLLLFTFKRPYGEVNERGKFKKIYWRHNSKSLCVITSLNYVYIYSIDITQDTDCFNLHDSSDDTLNRKSPEFYLKQRRPIIKVYLSVVAKLENEAQCIVSLKDELLVCLTDGWVHRLSWKGDVLKELSFNIRNVSFSVDQISAKTEKFPLSSIFIIDIVYCPLIGGLCAVLEDGRAILLVANTAQFKPQELAAVWAHGINDAVCCSTNHKFRLIYFGCKNGDIAGYSLDDSNGALTQIFRVKMTVKNGTEYLSRIGQVAQIQCLSQGFVFSVIWEMKSTDVTATNGEISTEFNHLTLNETDTINGTSTLNQTKSSGVCNDCPPAIAVFSPFGAQWWSSFEGSLYSLPSNSSYTCMDWGPDGYQLWLGTDGCGLSCINFVHSMPDFAERVVMLGGDRVYLSPLRLHDEFASAPHFVWKVCKIPYDYIASNWPLKYVGMDAECNRVLVAAGARGFCYCTLKNNKWRLFRKEAQESDLCLTADIVVYKEFIIVAVCNTTNESEHIFAFNLMEQLDKDLAAVSMPVNRILSMNSRQDYLLTFDSTATVSIYTLQQKMVYDASLKQQKFSLEISCIAEVRVGELLPHPSCVVSVQLAQLNYHSDAAEFFPGMDSLLLNVSGHLLLLSPIHHQQQQEQEEQQTKGIGSQLDNSFQLHPPTLIASNVERVWIHSSNRDIPHLNKALWINTGCRKMQIWLPLSQKVNSGNNGANILNYNHSLSTNKGEGFMEIPRRNFISKRIMLPIELNLYPLVIDEDCLACGVECFTLTGSANSPQSSSVHDTIVDNAENGNDYSSTEFTSLTTTMTTVTTKCAPILVHSLVRNTEVFLHHLLKQLLKRNLGSYALAIASLCRTLPYFSHVLELLLHDVLDEEATSSEPIPDPLLPTVVSFINEFPEYLQTVVHCARKTELAFWNMLFSVSHHPRELFKMSVTDGDLDTATCCLILLQNVEPISVSTQFATQLLNEALSKHRWMLARDIVRFMQSIDCSEFEQNLDSPPLYQKLTSRSSSKQKCNILPTDTASTDELLFNNSGKMMTNGNLNTVASGATISGNNMRTPISAGAIGLRRQSSSSASVSGNVGSVGNSSNILSISTNSTQNANLMQYPFTRTSPPTKVPHSSGTFTATNSPPSINASSSTTATANFSFDFGLQIEELLEKHGSSLLEDFALRDFGAFASHFGLNLKEYFANPRNAFKVSAEDFPLALMKLHAQFSWPYPVAANENAFVVSYSTNSLSSMYDSEGSLRVSNHNGVCNSPTIEHSTSSSGIIVPKRNTSSLINGVISPDDTTSMCSTTSTITSTFNSTVNAVESAFSWKVFEKLCKNSKVKGTIQSEKELDYIMNWLATTDALEWNYLLCIMKQDVKTFNEKLLNELDNQKRLALFLKNVRDGTTSIYAWAEAKCPAYIPVIRVFKEFLEC